MATIGRAADVSSGLLERLPDALLEAPPDSLPEPDSPGMSGMTGGSCGSTIFATGSAQTDHAGWAPSKATQIRSACKGQSETL